MRGSKTLQMSHSNGAADQENNILNSPTETKVDRARLHIVAMAVNKGYEEKTCLLHEQSITE